MSPKSENKENKFEQFISVASAQKFFQGLPENCKKNILQVLMADKSAVSKSIEIIDKAPELESENYKIDKDMSLEVKLRNRRTIKKDANGIAFLEKHLGVFIEKNEPGEAYVREYLEGKKTDIGVQKFNLYAVKMLGLENRLPKDFDEFKKLTEKWKEANATNHLGFMRKYFSKDGKLVLSGYRHDGITYGSNGRFCNTLRCECLWLGDDSSVQLNVNNLSQRMTESTYNIAHSIRLVKGR